MRGREGVYFTRFHHSVKKAPFVGVYESCVVFRELFYFEDQAFIEGRFPRFYCTISLRRLAPSRHLFGDHLFFVFSPICFLGGATGFFFSNSPVLSPSVAFSLPPVVVALSLPSLVMRF